MGQSKKDLNKAFRFKKMCHVLQTMTLRYSIRAEPDFPRSVFILAIFAKIHF